MTYDSNDELREAHASSTDEEEAATTELVDEGQRADGDDGVDDVADDGDDEGVADAGLLEERRAVVEDEVDAGELLHRLEEDAGPCAEAVAVLVVAEAVRPGAAAGLLLQLERGGDEEAALLDFGGLGGEGEQAAEGFAGFGFAALEEEEAGGFGEEEHAAAEDGTPGELDGDGSSPCRVALLVFGGVKDDGGEESTDSD